MLAVHLLKTKKELKKLCKQETAYIYKNDLDRACFQHDMAYGKYEDLTKRTQLDKVVREKAFEIASNPKYDGYQRRIASMVLTFLDKKSIGKVLNKHQINNLQMNFINQLSEYFKKEKFILNLKTIFGV